MGQYWIPVNLDKREFIHPHRLGNGLKLIEQVASLPGTGTALLILLAVMPERRGGGDLEPDPVIGRWAGDRVVLVGDYSEDDDFPVSPIPLSIIYVLCDDEEGLDETKAYLKQRYPEEYELIKDEHPFRDISDAVCRVIERELGGRYVGDGWRDFVTAEPSQNAA